MVGGVVGEVSVAGDLVPAPREGEDPRRRGDRVPGRRRHEKAGCAHALRVGLPGRPHLSPGDPAVGQDGPLGRLRIQFVGEAPKLRRTHAVDAGVCLGRDGAPLHRGRIVRLRPARAGRGDHEQAGDRHSPRRRRHPGCVRCPPVNSTDPPARNHWRRSRRGVRAWPRSRHADDYNSLSSARTAVIHQAEWSLRLLYGVTWWRP